MQVQPHAIIPVQGGGNNYAIQGANPHLLNQAARIRRIGGLSIVLGLIVGSGFLGRLVNRSESVHIPFALPPIILVGSLLVCSAGIVWPHLQQWQANAGFVPFLGADESGPL